MARGGVSCPRDIALHSTRAIIMRKDPVESVPPPWWTDPPDTLVRTLSLDPNRGLDTSRAELQRQSFGANTLAERRPATALKLILEGAAEPMMLVLLSIAGLSLAFGKQAEAAVMMFVVATYVVVEFANKFHADRVMARLRELTRPTTTVLRDGTRQEIPTSAIVVGDLVLLSEGARVTADLRLLESLGLQVNEAPLTGESLPVRKQVLGSIPPGLSLGERADCVWSGTLILSGEAKGVVLAVGDASIFGTIARQAQAESKDRTPTQDAMTRLAKTLAVLAVIISLLIPAIGYLRGLGFQEMVLTWLSLTFLMIPGQPPVIITMALALASLELARGRILVKRLRGVETLGHITSILADKTGTITENRMKVDRFILGDLSDVLPGSVPDRVGEGIRRCLPRYPVDPTDRAVQDALGENSVPIGYQELSGFSEERPWRTLRYSQDSVTSEALAGEPERLIEAARMPDERKKALLTVVKQEAEAGRRVVGYASRTGSDDDNGMLGGLELIGLAILSDPVRPGVVEAMASLHRAGITTHLVTGDHPAVALAIAREIGIGGTVLFGSELQALDDQAIAQKVTNTRVFARVTPMLKLRLARVLQQCGETVAVIGDGVNDAPSLRAANVGIAMGEIGTDIAKESADLILVDDNFVHIPDAIWIGRKAMDNFRKGLTYYLSAKAILLAIFLVPLALGLPFPFAPIHIILTELLMDLASSSIFVTEAAEPDLCRRRPEPIGKWLDTSLVTKVARNGAPLAVAILAAYFHVLWESGDLVTARTAAFTAWLLGHVLLALNLKQSRVPLLRQGVFSNRFATVWLTSMLALTFAMTTFPRLHAPLQTTGLPLHTWALLLFAVALSTCWIEVTKWIAILHADPASPRSTGGGPIMAPRPPFS